MPADGLVPDTDYTITAVAHNDTGPTTSLPYAFHTPAEPENGPPTVTTPTSWPPST